MVTSDSKLPVLGFYEDGIRYKEPENHIEEVANELCKHLTGKYVATGT